MRLSIEISPEQHKRLKAAAALKAKSIKDYVLERTLPDLNEQAELHELEMFLKLRMETANKGGFSSRSVTDIFDEVEKEGYE